MTKPEFFQIKQSLMASLVALTCCFSCQQTDRTLGIGKKGGGGNGGEPEKPLTIPPNFGPNQFKVGSTFVFKESNQSLEDGKTWIEDLKNCYHWKATETTENTVSFGISWAPDCVKVPENESEWHRQIKFSTTSGQVISDQIVVKSLVSPGDLNNKTIASIFFTNNKKAIAHTILKDFKVEQIIYSAFKVGNSVFWDNSDTPLHTLLLENLEPGPKGSNKRTLTSLIEAKP